MNPTRYRLYTPAAIALWLDAKAVWRAGVQALRQRADDWRRQRRARASLEVLLHLSNMNPHLLRDLGLDRSELLSMAQQPGDDTRARFVRRG